MDFHCSYSTLKKTKKNLKGEGKKLRALHVMHDWAQTALALFHSTDSSR